MSDDKFTRSVTEAFEKPEVMRDFDELKYEYTPQEMNELRKVLIRGDADGEFRIGGGDETPMIDLTIYRTDFRADAAGALLFESICKKLGIPSTVAKHIVQVNIEASVFQWHAYGETDE